MAVEKHQMREAMLAQRAPGDQRAGAVAAIDDQLVVLARGNHIDPLAHLPERHVHGAGHVSVRELALGAHVENGGCRSGSDARKQRPGADATRHAVRAPAGTGTSAAATASAATMTDSR